MGTPAQGTRGSGRDFVLFCLIACAFSWSDWGLVIASSRGWVPFHLGPNPWGSFGPAVAALVVTALSGGLPRVRALLGGLLAWRFPLRVWVVALLLPPALVALSAAVLAATGVALRPMAAARAGELLLLALLLLVFGGPLGEEIGWRGFLLPRLLPRMHAIAASLVVAAIWTAWHLPLFWMPGAVQAGGNILYFAAFVAAFSILMTWIFVASGRSLLSAIAFHFAINASTYIGPMLQPELSWPAFNRILLAATWLAALVAARDLWRRARPVAP